LAQVKRGVNVDHAGVAGCRVGLRRRNSPPLGTASWFEYHCAIPASWFEAVKLALAFPSPAKRWGGSAVAKRRSGWGQCGDALAKAAPTRHIVSLRSRCATLPTRGGMKKEPAFPQTHTSLISPQNPHTSAIPFANSHTSAISRRDAPECCRNVSPRNYRGRRESRVPAAPAASYAK
jgi:hypothetical protein